MGEPAKRKRPANFDLGHLSVAEDLAGKPLAPRWRRVAAFAIDWALVFLPAIGVALTVSLLFMRLSEPDAFQALRVLWNSKKRPPDIVRKAWGDIAPLLVKMESPGLPEGLHDAVSRGDRIHAGRLLEGRELNIHLAIGEGERPEINLPENTIEFQLEKLIPRPLRALVLYGVLAIYFTLFISSKRGATPGKRLLRIRVASLEGGRVPLLESLERFAGYIEIPATLGFALLALWRDPNRRLPHDRVAGTVVLLDRPVSAPETKQVEVTPSPEEQRGEKPAGA